MAQQFEDLSVTSSAFDRAFGPPPPPAFFCQSQLYAQAKPKYGQRVHMCALFKKHEGNRVNACAEFAQAVREGLVKHKSNLNKVTHEQYAVALWYDGAKKGWLR